MACEVGALCEVGVEVAADYPVVFFFGGVSVEYLYFDS